MRVGVVIHPTRDVEGPLQALLAWARSADVEIGQIRFAGADRRVAEETPPEGCDLIVAIGGDGTTLSAIRSAAPAHRPVMGVGCGSLGVLTIVAAGKVARSLQRFAAGDWIRRELPALTVADGSGGGELVAYNDIVIGRQREGQVRVAARVDDRLFARLAGDGCIVSTPVGSSAYSLAAGGPLIPPTLDAFLLTPLPTHGGFHPPLAVEADSELELEIASGAGSARLELDGQLGELRADSLTVRLRPNAAVLVGFSDQEPFLAGLRSRGIISDSPRILAEDSRD